MFSVGRILRGSQLAKQLCLVYLSEMVTTVQGVIDDLELRDSNIISIVLTWCNIFLANFN